VEARRASDNIGGGLFGMNLSVNLVLGAIHNIRNSLLIVWGVLLSKLHINQINGLVDSSTVPRQKTLLKPLLSEERRH
jgi:hypothetical protein